MPDQDNGQVTEARRGERTISLRINFFTNNLGQEPGKVIPKHASEQGMVALRPNASHGIGSSPGIPFHSLAGLLVAIEDLLIREGITLHPNGTSRQYMASADVACVNPSH
jgi:hypothetical protein